MIARAIKEEILALTNGTSPRRRYASMFSDDEEGTQQTASMLSGHSQEQPNGEVRPSAAAVAQQSSQTHHAEPSASSYPRSVHDWAARSAAAGPHQDAAGDMVSDCGGVGGAMHLDIGVPSPRVNGGSDASMHSCCGSADEEEAEDGGNDGGGNAALTGRKRSSSKLNPPKEEDRTLPLKKLFENLDQLDTAGAYCSEQGLLSNGSATSVSVARLLSAPKAASVAGDLPHREEPHMAQQRRAEMAPSAPDATQKLSLRDRAALARVLVSRDSGASVSSAGEGQRPRASSDLPPVSPGRPLSPAPAGFVSRPLSPAGFARAHWPSVDSLATSAGAGPSSAHASLLHNLSQVCSRDKS